MTETRYQRVAREQAERQAARERRMKLAQRRARVKRIGEQIERQDGYEKLDDLGESPDH